jgi:hypothetical protein
VKNCASIGVGLNRARLTEQWGHSTMEQKMKDNLVQLVLRPSNDNDYLHAAWMMEEGGSFAAAIGDAYIAADPQNRARLRAAFPDLFTQFYNKWVNK